MQKNVSRCQVLSQEKIAPGIFSLWLQAEEIARTAVPGQFVSVYCPDPSRLLPRPISLCETDAAGGKIRLVYRVTGENTGTQLLSELRPGDALRVLGPVGNGFPLEKAQGKKVILIGGGIGIPPMLETAKRLESPIAVLGYRSLPFLKEEFEKQAEVHIAAEDGCEGTKGTVLDAIREQNVTGDMIFACGPTPMLRAVAAYAAENGLPCWVSLEERMACSVGACLACVCRAKTEDPHFGTRTRRVCKDGPVFSTGEIDFVFGSSTAESTKSSSDNGKPKYRTSFQEEVEL